MCLTLFRHLSDPLRALFTWSIAVFLWAHAEGGVATCDTHGLSTLDSPFWRSIKFAPRDDWAFAEDSQFPIFWVLDGSHALVMIGPPREGSQYRPLRAFDSIHALCISRNAMQTTWRVVFGECDPPYLAGYAELCLLMKRRGLQILRELLAQGAKNAV